MMAASRRSASLYPWDMTSQAPFSIDDRAVPKLNEIRQSQPEGDQLALAISIVGITGDEFDYELAMMLPERAAPDDVVVAGEIPVVISAGDVENLRGAVLTMSRDLLHPGFRIENPNSPSPAVLGDVAAVELSGDVAQRAAQVLDQAINPAIAAHGGSVAIAAVEVPTLYVRFSGGCQGCGMASVTLSQGIEATIRSLVPEITKVMDVTDHASGENPYYEESKK